MAIRTILSSFRFLLVVTAGLACAATLAIGLTIWWLHSVAIREASGDASNLATVLAEQTNRAVQSIDLMLNELYERTEALGARTQDDFRRLIQGRDTHQLLAERMARLSHVAVISLTDKNGEIINSTLHWPMPPTNISNREHFQRIKNDDNKGIYISEPVRDRFKGQWTVFFSKRINNTNNEFLGMISIGVRLSYFQHIYESVNSLNNFSFLLLRKDGTVIVRYPDSQDRAGEKPPVGSPWHLLASAGGGNYRSPGHFDGEASQVAVRPLRDYPLVVNVAVSEAATLATWRIQAITIGFGTLLVNLCLAFLMKALSKQFYLLATSKTALVKKSNELEYANAKIDVALNNMSQGLCMFDATQRVVVCNNRYIQMYGLSPEVAKPGVTLRELIKHRKETGSFTGDVDEYCSQVIDQVAKRQRLIKLVETADGRTIHMINQPTADGGWVSTHEEVTERHRAERNLQQREQELQTQNMLFETALDNMSQGLIMFDSAGKLVVHNERYVKMYRLSPEKVKPGCTLRDLFVQRLAAGTFAGTITKDPDKHYATLNASRFAGGQVESKVVKLPDGRAILITNRPMANGGWVSTHEDVTERKQAEQRIEHMAHYDALTDLPNRATFNDTMKAAINLAGANGEKFAVLSIDLDHFKDANDSYGHVIGDALLREVARRMQVAAEGAFIARLGGDEFMVIVTDGAQPAAASALADRLLATFVDDFEVEGHRLKLGMSIGVATYPTDGTDAKTLIINADAALYRAKAEFRGSALFFEPEMGERLRERHAMQEDLRKAIDRGELLLHYQPQMKMSGETIGFEALVRWQCPTRGLVDPGTFIPIAEESSLIIPVGEWVLREACREAASWPQPLTIAVNISPSQFRQGDLPRLVHSILLETGLSPDRLELEVTESVMVQDFSRAVSILNRLKSLGVRIAMDDFGTGYSSLSYLQSFRCNKIKIDRIFICDLESNHHSRAIVRAVVGLGHSLDLPILAEGVETEAQHAYLVQEGCDEVQGYLTGRPLPIANYAKLVGRQATAQRCYAVAV